MTNRTPISHVRRGSFAVDAADARQRALLLRDRADLLDRVARSDRARAARLDQLAAQAEQVARICAEAQEMIPVGDVHVGDRILSPNRIHSDWLAVTDITSHHQPGGPYPHDRVTVTVDDGDILDLPADYCVAVRHNVDCRIREIVGAAS